MVFLHRSKDNPLDVGRAADQNESVDNEDYLFSLIRYISPEIAEPSTQVSTGDSKRLIHLPADLNGMNLVYCHAFHAVAGAVANDTLIQIRNVTDAVDVLLTRLMIDLAETDSKDATTPYVINVANDDVDTNDIWAIDVDQVPTTVPYGLVVTLGFQQP